MVDEAAKLGADAIEFQIAKADEFYVKNHEAHKIYLEREFSDPQHGIFQFMQVIKKLI